MATKSSILTAELAKLALTTVSLEADGALDAAIPVPLAQRLCAALTALDVESSWAPDHEDSELAWVYITVEVAS